MLLRLDAAIRTAGIAIVGIGGKPGDSTTIRVSPPSLQVAAQPTIDAFDWSDTAQSAWDAQQIKQQAKAALVATDNHVMTATRNAFRLVFQAMVTRAEAKINELVAAHNAKTGDTIAPLPPASTWPELIATCQAVIDAETHSDQ